MPTKKAFWDYIKNNVFSLLTVIIGAIALVLSRLGVLPADIVPAMTLSLVLLLATSQLIDQSRKLERIENSLEDGFSQTVLALEGVRVIPLTEPEVGLSYLAERIRNTKNRADLASLSPSIPRNNPGAVEWEKSIENALLANRIRFRYVCVFNDEARVNRVNKHLMNPKITKYFVGYFPVDSKMVPMPNFLLVDDDEVIVIFPYTYGDPEVWLSIKHPDVVRAFARYFQRLWGESIKLTRKDIEKDPMKTISLPYI